MSFIVVDHKQAKLVHGQLILRQGCISYTTGVYSHDVMLLADGAAPPTPFGISRASRQGRASVVFFFLNVIMK